MARVLEGPGSSSEVPRARAILTGVLLGLAIAFRYQDGFVAMGLAVLVIALGVYFYRQYTHRIRQEALFSALQIQNATIGQAANDLRRPHIAEQMDHKNRERHRAGTDVARDAAQDWLHNR